jgi:hypothetical protein
MLPNVTFIPQIKEGQDHQAAEGKGHCHEKEGSGWLEG